MAASCATLSREPLNDYLAAGGTPDRLTATQRCALDTIRDAYQQIAALLTKTPETKDMLTGGWVCGFGFAGPRRAGLDHTGPTGTAWRIGCQWRAATAARSAGGRWLIAHAKCCLPEKTEKGRRKLRFVLVLRRSNFLPFPFRGRRTKDEEEDEEEAQPGSKRRRCGWEQLLPAAGSAVRVHPDLLDGESGIIGLSDHEYIRAELPS